MALLSPILRTYGDGGLMFFCPACKNPHAMRTGVGEGARWSYNGDPKAPTFQPSILATYNGPDADQMDGDDRAPSAVCHSYVTDGHIQFLGDCTHEMAGQTVPLPELPEWLRNEAEST